jgi:hypothetical protein
MAQWNKLKNVTLTGQGTINGNGDTGWYNSTYMSNRPTLLGLLWIDGLTISGECALARGCAAGGRLAWRDSRPVLPCGG